MKIKKNSQIPQWRRTILALSSIRTAARGKLVAKQVEERSDRVDGRKLNR